MVRIQNRAIGAAGRLRARTIRNEGGSAGHRAGGLRGFIVAASTLGLMTFASGIAQADCCHLVKVDEEPPTVTVRACTPNAQQSCDMLLFEGTLAVGGSQEVCPVDDIVVYAEFDSVLQTYGPYTRAVCTSATDVEL